MSHVVSAGSIALTVGVYLNLELNVVHFIVNGSVKLANIRRSSEEETPEFIPAFQVQDCAELIFNFGYLPFKFDVSEFCKVCPQSELRI